MTLSSATPFFFKPLADFEIGEHRGAGPLGNRDRVAQVIAVAVRQQNEIRLHLVRLHRRRRRVVQKRIEQNRLAGRLDRPALWPNQVIVVMPCSSYCTSSGLESQRLASTPSRAV